MNQFENTDNLGKYIWRNHNGLYANGASWNGEVVLNLVFWSVIATIIAMGFYNFLSTEEYVCTEQSVLMATLSGSTERAKA